MKVHKYSLIPVLVVFQLNFTLRWVVTQSSEAVDLAIAASTINPKFEQPLHSCKANNLDEQIVNGKWKNYDIVLDNCLVLEFIDSTEESINFYLLLRQQKSLMTRLLECYDDTIQRLMSAAEKGNKIKYELALETSRRQANRMKLKLSKLGEESEIKISLIEVELRELMDRCTLARNQQQESPKLSADCIQMKEQALDRARELCDRLRGQNAILTGRILERQVKSNLELQHTS